MKKIISYIITFMLLFSCLGLTVFANPSSATISDDLQTLYLDGSTYHRFNASMLETEYYTSGVSVELNSNQQETIEEIVLDRNSELTMLLANIYYKDGAVLTVTFLQEDYLESYEKLTSGEVQTHIIDFEYPDDNTITAEKTALFGESVILSSEELQQCDYFPVRIESGDGSLSAYTGCLLTIDSDYYYVDLKEAHIESWYDCIPYEYNELPAHVISDAELIANIETGLDAYFSDDLGFLLNDDLSETIATIFFILVFGIIPFVILVIFLILAIRSKQVYKKMFRVIYILSAVEIAVFGIVAAIIMMSN